MSYDPNIVLQKVLVLSASVTHCKPDGLTQCSLSAPRIPGGNENFLGVNIINFVWPQVAGPLFEMEK